jgi:hypothetical protein
MQEQIPLSTIHLFPELDKKLIELLKSLSPGEWNKPTIAKKWMVKDIAAHLLDTNIRTISFSRDKHSLQPSSPINSYKELVDYLNELNAVWVNAYKRISPQLLVEQLETSGQQFYKELATLDPFADAMFSVAWAGETVSTNWFHIAREYTEKFIHQQQIRDAVDKPGIMTKELFYPFIDTFMYGLPHTFRNTVADNGTTIQVTVTTEIGGDWFLTRNAGNWQLTKVKTKNITAIFTIDPDTAWKLFSKGMTAEEAKKKVIVSGSKELADTVFQMVSVMA